jgi:hypothetical protein
MPIGEALEKCCDRVRGIDVHPVAVQIARVTYLLAMGQERLRNRTGPLSIPVYLGDSLQWNTHAFMGKRSVEIKVPGERRRLSFPFSVAEDPALFDSVISTMLSFSEDEAERESFADWLRARDVTEEADVEMLADTYDDLLRLRKAGRDHIWGFVARNLVQPAWLSRHDQKSDVVVGNPPWLPYRNMSRETKKEFKKACQERGLWAGGKVATHQDLSAYFFARCVELYLPTTGVIGFVMPYAVMRRQQYEGFRTGNFAAQGKPSTRRGSRKSQLLVSPRWVRFTDAWAFPDDVQPLFPVPSCVLVAEIRTIKATGPMLPDEVHFATGKLTRRDATPEEAKESLSWRRDRWPKIGDDESGSEYRAAFHQGATMVPRMLTVVEAVETSIGSNPAAPLVESRRSSQEKQPWKGLPTLRMNVESTYLRPLYLGESLAPFRLLSPATAVIPWDESLGSLMDAGAARRHGEVQLARWLSEAERIWNANKRSRMTWQEQVDYYGKLSAQFPIVENRVVYSKAGSQQAAALLTDKNAVVDHKLYWAKLDTVEEGYYLLAILNSETTRARVEHLQSRGQWGARDFDKVMFSLPIPKYEDSDELHQKLADAAKRAAAVAAAVDISEGEYFVKVRGRIRDALREDGIAEEIDKLVEELLGPA